LDQEQTTAEISVMNNRNNNTWSKDRETTM